MRYLLCLLFSFATAASAQVASGQWLFQKRNANGTYAPYGLSWSNGQAVRLSGGVPSTFTPFDGAFSSLTGTLSLSQVPDALLTIAKTSGLQTALDAKLAISTAAATYEPIITAGTTGQYFRGDKSWQTLNAAAVGLGNVENTALSTWTGSTNLATLGTITAGTWQGSIIAPAYLGTGSSITTKFLRGDGTWQTVESGITIDTTAVSGGTVGRVLYHKTGNVVGEIETSAGGNGGDDNGKLATYNASGNLTASQFNVQDGLTSANYGPAALTFDDGAGNSTTLFVTLSGSNTVTLAANTGTILTTGALGTGVATALGVNVGTSGAFVVNGGALGTPSSGTLTNCSFPTLNQNTTGSAASLSIAGQTGLLTFTGITSTNREKTVRDAADTILELGGSYTPTGTWTNMNLVTPALGTPSAIVLTNATGSPTGISLTKSQLNTIISDDDPAYVATSNTFTAAQTVTAGTNSPTPATGVTLQNTTAAISGTQSASPRFILTGQGYKTGGTPGSQALDWSIYNLPVQGTSSDLSLMFSYRVAGGSWNDQMRLAATDQVNYRGLAFAQAFSLIPSLSSNAAKFDIGTASFAYDSSSATKFSVNANSTTVSVPSGWNYGWTSSSTAAGTNDTSITRVSAGVVGVPAVRIGASGTAISQSTVTTTALDTSTIAALSVREDTFTVSEATTTTPFSFTFSAAQNDDLHVILMRSDAGHIYVKWYNSNAVTARAPAGNITIRTWVP